MSQSYRRHLLAVSFGALVPPFPMRLGLLISIWVSPVLPARETGCARGKQNNY